VPATQILFRTSVSTGRAVATVTTVVQPVTGTAQPRVAAYLSFYDALSSKCNPSYTLRGGDAGTANQQTSDVEQAAVQVLRAEGFLVTVPDMEGPRADFAAGPEYGTSTLDGITATIQALDLDPATPVGMMGYSGGSIAADWASELQPGHAPGMNLVGTALGGIPVDLRHNFPYIDGVPEWSAVIPAALLGVSRATGIRLRHYLSPWGRTVVRTMSHQCIGEFSGEFPNLTIKRLMKPRYADLLHVPVFRRLMARLAMGSAPGHPSGPMLMMAANVDGTGDGVTIAADQERLAAEYCRQGVPVAYQELSGLDHTQGGAVLLSTATAWLEARFAGVPAPSTC
jgi:hypothetical protein